MITGMMARRIAAAADPFAAYLIANLTMQGSHGSTTFTDTTGRSWSAVNNATITTADSDVSTGAATFDGVNDGIQTSDSDDFHFGTSVFTIEAFFKLPDVSGNHCIISQWSSVQRSFILYISGSSVGFAASSGGSSNIVSFVTASGVIAANTLTHIALERNNSHATSPAGFQLYVNGTQVTASGGLSAATSLYNSSASIRVGLDADNNNDMLGLIAGVRVYKGIFKYGGNFTPPEYPFT